VKLLSKLQKFGPLLQIRMALFPFIWVQNADFLRSTGKIYSVAAVIVIVFAGIAFFLYRLDNKLTKLENQSKHEQ